MQKKKRAERPILPPAIFWNSLLNIPKFGGVFEDDALFAYLYEEHCLPYIHPLCLPHLIIIPPIQMLRVPRIRYKLK